MLLSRKDSLRNERTLYSVIGDRLYNFSGNSACKAVVGNVLCDHCACCDNNVVSDAYSRKYSYISAYPHIIADMHRFCKCHVLTSCHRRDRVTDCCYQRIWSDHYVVSDIDLSYVKYGKVIISREIVSDEYFFAVVAVKGLCYPYLFANTAQQGFQMCILSVIIGIIDRIVFSALNNCIFRSCFYLGIIIAVFQSPSSFSISVIFIISVSI